MTSGTWKLVGAFAACGLLALACAGSTDDELSTPSGGTGGATGGSGGGTGGSSVFPSCNDGAKGDKETDVDCGGTCPACTDKKACKSIDDCQSKICADGVCGGCSQTSPCPNPLACVAGICQPCTGNADCAPGQACVSGKCGACSTTADCSKGQACVNGACGACTLASQCGGTDACVSGVCQPCTLSSQCGGGKVCDFGRCLAGKEVQMYQCPPSQTLGGGSWGFYGCQNQVASTPTCTIIEYPSSKSFDCTPIGKLALVTDSAPAAPGTTQVAMYQCPPQQSLGGGSWAFYGCQNQLASTPTCTIIEAPTTKSFNCTAAGKLSLSSSTPSAPPGGKVVPMYQCPPQQSLGGGSWAFYGCQGQLASTPTCTIIEYPSSQSFNCTAAGSMVLGP